MSILENTVAVLRLIVNLQRSVTMSDVATQLDIPKSTASRVLKQLTEHGLLQRDAQSLAYSPGLLVLEAAHVVHQESFLGDHIEQALRELRDATGYTGYVSVLDGRDVFVLRVVSGTQALRVVTSAGTRSPAWATSTGRVLLARFTPEQLRGWLDVHGDAISRNAPTAIDDLERRLAQIREQGWGQAMDEAVSGVASVSCCVADRRTGEAMAFCLSFPSALATEAEMQRIAQLLSGHARRIGRLVNDPNW